MGLFYGFKPTIPRQAKIAGTWEQLMARLALCVLPADVDDFQADMTAEWFSLPPQWRDPLADQIELKREQIAAEDIGEIVRSRFDFT